MSLRCGYGFPEESGGGGGHSEKSTCATPVTYSVEFRGRLRLQQVGGGGNKVATVSDRRGIKAIGVCVLLPSAAHVQDKKQRTHTHRQREKLILLLLSPLYYIGAS